MSHGFYRSHNRTKAKSKLSLSDIQHIRKLRGIAPAWVLAEYYGCSQSLISHHWSGYKSGRLSLVPKNNRGYKGKLSKRQVISIRTQYRCGVSQNRLAQIFCLSQSTVYAIVHNRTYNWS